MLRGERPDPQPAQGGDMAERAAGGGQVARQAAHVDALAGLHLEHGMVGVLPLQQFEPVHPCRAGRQLGRAALTGHVVGALARDLDRGEGGRDLHDVADEAGQGGAQLVIAGPDRRGAGHLPVGVVGVARLAEAEREAIHLGPVHDVGHGLGGVPERDRQHAGRQRVERAAMARLLRVERTLDPVDHVRAGDPRRLVDDEPPVERAAAAFAHAMSVEARAAV